MSQFDNKELSLGADVIGKNFLEKKKNSNIKNIKYSRVLKKQLVRIYNIVDELLLPFISLMVKIMHKESLNN